MEKGHRITRPRFIAPMLYKTVRRLPGRGEFFYEVKHNGCRTVAVKDSGNVTLFASNGRPLEYSEPHAAVRRLKARSVVIDGELVAIDKAGKPQPLTMAGRHCPVRFRAFDLLHFNNRDIMHEPIERRKERLCTITLDSAMLFSPALHCEADLLIEEMKHLSLGTVVAKRKGSVYEPGKRSDAWLKLQVTTEVRDASPNPQASDAAILVNSK
jgi:bifunctional non-homologous end joining protein LigD